MLNGHPIIVKVYAAKGGNKDDIRPTEYCLTRTHLDLYKYIVSKNKTYCKDSTS